MTFKTNKVNGMVLDSTGRLTLGSLTPGVSGSALSVNGSSYVSGNHLVKGTITGQENLYLSNLSGKIGVGVGSAESSIHTANLKVITPTTMGIHLGMDSATGAAGIEIVAASTTQNAYIDFTYPGVANRGKILYSNNLGCMTFTTTAVERMRIDNAGEVLIDSTSSDGIYKLKVIGPCFFSAAVSGPTSIATSGAVTCATVTATGLITCGSLTAGLPKNVDVVHPTKEGYRLRHRCLEGPLAYLYYPYQYQCVVGLNTFDLPDYFTAMNINGNGSCFTV